MGLIVDADSVLSKLADLANLNYSTAIKDSCLLVEREAKQNCPVKSGELRRSIESRVISDTEGEVGTTLFYAPYVEFGTGIFSSQGDGRKDVPWFYKDAQGKGHITCGQHPHPYLIPAYENNRDKIQRIFQKYLREKIG